MSFYCNEHLLEDLQGDLHEFYLRNLTARGRFMARLIYFFDVLKFIRLYTVKTPKLFRQMNYFAIFKNSFKTSLRSIYRNKLFSGINVIGLSISMSVGLLVISLFMELNGFDTFHQDVDKIYRVMNTITDEDGLQPYASTSILTGQRIEEEFTGVKAVAITRSGFGIDASYGDKVIPLRGKHVTPGFADVFSFEVLEGNLKRALSEPNSLVLTEKATAKLFGDESGLNKVVKSGDGRNFVINAIIKDFPKKSHINVEALCSFKTFEEENKNSSWGSKWYVSWKAMWSNHVYVRLNEDYSEEQFQKQLDDLSERQNDLNDANIALGAITLTGIIPGPKMYNMGGPSFEISILYILMSLAAFILISACFNYTNLSIARSLRRSKEVGIRKTVGASRGQVFFQFVIEAAIVSSFALVIAYGLFFLLRPFFIETLGYSGEILEMTLTPSIIFAFILFALAIGVLAGMFPSYLMSRMQVKSIFNDMSSIKLFSNISLRKALIIFQFSLSMIFIMSAIIGFKQYKYMLDFDLGYTTENVLNLSLSNNDYKTVETELRKISQVKDVSFSLMIPSVGSMYTIEIKDPILNDSLDVAYNKVSPNYLKLHEHDLIAGSNFDESYVNSENKTQLIVNKKLLERFRISDPEKAIGRKFKMDGGIGTVVGVINDFHFGTTENELGPFLFVLGQGSGKEDWPDFYHANIKLNKGDVKEAVNQIEAAWRRVDDVHQFNALFYSEEIERTYAFLKSLVSIIGVLAIIAVSISTLGLLGMVVFTTETRLKEISIRKILGATEGNLLILLGKSFMILLCIAAAISIPVTSYTFNEYVLQDYIYRPKVGFWELVGGCTIIFLIGLIIVFSQTIVATRTNPSKTLRSE